MYQPGKRVTREELYEAVWSKTIKSLIEKWNTSYLQVGEACRRLQVPRPKPAYWQWLLRGRLVKRKPLRNEQGESIMHQPLAARRRRLGLLFRQVSLDHVLLIEAVPKHGCEFFRQVVELGLEGVMAKRLDGPYLPGRRKQHWQKIKPMRQLVRPSSLAFCQI